MWRKFLPEVLSLSLGFAALDRVELALELQHFFRFLWRIPFVPYHIMMITTTLVDTVLCAIVFYLAKRLNMWRHLIFYLSGWILFVVITNPHEMIWGWPDIALWVVFELLLRVAVPVSLVCLVYAILFVFRFNTNTTQGGESE